MASPAPPLPSGEGGTPAGADPPGGPAGDPDEATLPVERVFLGAEAERWEIEAAAAVPEGRAALDECVDDRPGRDVPTGIAAGWRDQCLVVYTVRAGVRSPVDLSLQPHLLPLHVGGPRGATPPPAIPIVPGVNWAASNSLLVVLLVSLMALSLSRIVSGSLFAFYCQYVLQVEHYEWWLGLVLALELVAATVSTPYWLWLSSQGSDAAESEGGEAGEGWCRSAHRSLCLVFGQSLADMDQRLVFILGTALGIPVVVVAAFALGRGDVLGFAGVMLITGLTEGGCEFLIAALVKTAIDYDTRFTGLRREAQHLTYISVVTHWIDIPASSLVLSFLSSAGYAANASSQPPRVVFLLKMFTLFVPALFMALSLACALAFPVGRTQHKRLFGDAAPVEVASDDAFGSSAASAAFTDEPSLDDAGCCFGADRPHLDDGEHTGDDHGARSEASAGTSAAAPGGGLPALHGASSSASLLAGSAPPGDHLLSARSQRALAARGVLFVERDEVSGRLLLPPELRYAASMGWLLDEFGADTLEEVAAGMRRRAGLEPRALEDEEAGDGDDDGVGDAPGGGGGEEDDDGCCGAEEEGETAALRKRAAAGTTGRGGKASSSGPAGLGGGEPDDEADGGPAGSAVPPPTVPLCGRCCACRSSLWCREVTYAASAAAVLVVSCVVVGALTALDYAPSLALSVLLLVGGAGLIAMYHCLRVGAASAVPELDFAQVRRYLRLRQIADGVSLRGDYRARAFDGSRAGPDA